MLIPAMGIDIKTSRDIKIASRKQVPMILAWSVHLDRFQNMLLADMQGFDNP
jgi:hypothetical protein